jgi:hypothetical protein
MLDQILTTIASAPQPLCAETLAHRLNKDTAVVEAMLDELCSMGRIRQVSSELACKACRAKAMCSISIPPSPSYALIIPADDSKEDPTGSLV